jgi:hypothetical protein
MVKFDATCCFKKPTTTTTSEEYWNYFNGFLNSYFWIFFSATTSKDFEFY